MAGTLLIDSIVRQTTVLIASLATAAGSRHSLSHVANQVLANLVAELKAQGLGNKVIADMFGMALRTYHDRVARLAESQSESGRSLWDAVLSFIQQHGTILRADVLRRFSRDGDAMVRGVLRDLVISGLVFRSGQGDHTAYRAASPEEQSVSAGSSPEAVANMLLVAVHRHGPCTVEAIQGLVPLADGELERHLERLVSRISLNARITRSAICATLAPTQPVRGDRARTVRALRSVGSGIAEPRAQAGGATGDAPSAAFRSHQLEHGMRPRERSDPRKRSDLARGGSGAHGARDARAGERTAQP